LKVSKYLNGGVQSYLFFPECAIGICDENSNLLFLITSLLSVLHYRTDV